MGTEPILAFDLMGTLVTDPYLEAYEAASGLPWEAFRRLRPGDAYPALERGEIAEGEYWGRLRAAGIPIDEERFHDVRAARCSSSPTIRRGCGMSRRRSCVASICRSARRTRSERASPMRSSSSARRGGRAWIPPASCSLTTAG